MVTDDLEDLDLFNYPFQIVDPGNIPFTDCSASTTYTLEDIF